MNGRSKQTSNPWQATILTAEMHAINLAMEVIRRGSQTKHAIYTDSLNIILKEVIQYTDTVAKWLQHGMYPIMEEKKN